MWGATAPERATCLSMLWLPYRFGSVFRPAIRNLDFGTWILELGIWNLELGIWILEFGI